MECARDGCHNPVVWSGKGRPPRYCSRECGWAERKRRKRLRTEAEWASALTHEPGEAALVDPGRDPDVQVVAVVHETIMLRNTYVRLSRDARSELAVRCEGMAKAIGDGLADNFRGAIEDE
jgi:hypothetical protein